MNRSWMGIGAGVLALAAAAGTFWNTGSTTRSSSNASAISRGSGVADAASPHAAAHPVAAVVVTAGMTSTPLWIQAAGTVKPEFESSVAARMTGRVANLRVREGDSVRRGQVLAEIDARDLDASVIGAAASLRAADVGLVKAQTAAAMEAMLDKARVGDTAAGIARAEAAVKAAQAQYDAVRAGPRRQEREQAAQVVAGAQASLTLSESNLQKISTLFQQGAVSRQLYETTLSDAQVARARLEAAKQAQSLVQEGSRPEDIRAAAEAVRAAQAALEQARVGMARVRAESLQVNVRRDEVHVAQAQINQSDAALEAARISRGFATVAAPFNGVVSARLVDVGAMASPGAPLLKIFGGQIRIEAVVPEENVRSIRVGDVVPVQLDAMRRGTPVGRVAEIAPQGDPASHTFLLKVVLPPESGARAGMFGRVRFPAGVTRQLLVPLSAVWEQQGLHYLFVADHSNIARLRMITIGDPVGDRVQVLSGLKPGEKIVISDIDRVTDGAPISPR